MAGVFCYLGNGAPSPPKKRPVQHCRWGLKRPATPPGGGGPGLSGCGRWWSAGGRRWGVGASPSWLEVNARTQAGASLRGNVLGARALLVISVFAAIALVVSFVDVVW